MDVQAVAEMMRMGERLLVPVGGIVCIVLGYKLFSLAGVTQNASGEFKLTSAFSFGVSMVGPGVFFALFGAYLLHASLTAPIRIGSGGFLGESPPGSPAAPGFFGARAPTPAEELRALFNVLPAPERLRAERLLDRLAPPPFVGAMPPKMPLDKPAQRPGDAAPSAGR